MNGDGHASPLDALIIINSLNIEGTRPLARWPTQSELQTDVSLDGFRSPIDVLLIINFLNNSISVSAGEGEGEASSTPTFFFLPERPASFRATNSAKTATASQPARDSGATEAELRSARHDAVFASESLAALEADDLHSAYRREWIVDQLLEDYLAESALAG
ncbi:MAG: hypothetical protein HYV60_17720 [Planctomycetia bacterium]|nr:hypothetical protein [Planctomycetia bacterium]